MGLGLGIALIGLFMGLLLGMAALEEAAGQRVSAQSQEPAWETRAAAPRFRSSQEAAADSADSGHSQVRARAA